MALKTKIYQKEKTLKVFSQLANSVKDTFNSRFLAKQFAVRDIKSQYRQSYFGLAWAFVTPLATAMVWILLSQSGVVNLTDTGVPYPLYAFAGTLLWSIIIDAINSPTSNTNAARSILSKINFPKEALVLSGIYKLLFNSSIKFVLIIILLFIYKIEFTSVFILFPLVIIILIFFGTTIGLLIAPVGLLYTDVAKIISLGMRFIMYASPVVYAVPKSGFMKTVMEMNPLTSLITVSRDVITGGLFNYLDYYFLVVLSCLPLFLFGLLLYRISIPVIVERLNA